MGLYDLAYVVDIVERRERFNYICVRFEFSEIIFRYGNGYRIYAEARVLIRGIGFDVVNVETEFSYGVEKLLKVALVFEFEVDFKVVGLVFEVCFDRGQCRKAEEKENIR